MLFADTVGMDIVISETEAGEYAEFKRQKRVAEVCKLLTKVECDLTGCDEKDLPDKAKACKNRGFGYVRVNPLQVGIAKQAASPLPVICVTEELNSTLKTKVTALKEAIKAGADEIVVNLSNGKNARKEVRKLTRAARGRRVAFRIADTVLDEREGACLSGIPVVSDTDKADYCKGIGCGTLTVETNGRSMLYEADRICTREFGRMADELFEEANRTVSLTETVDEKAEE